jgi:hypothetical protein
VETLIVLIIVALWAASAVVTALKGKPWFLLVGFLIGWCWIFGSLRLAKPQSWWARHFYDSTKLNASRMRFNTPAPVFEYPRH